MGSDKRISTPPSEAAHANHTSRWIDAGSQRRRLTRVHVSAATALSTVNVYSQKKPKKNLYILYVTTKIFYWSLLCIYLFYYFRSAPRLLHARAVYTRGHEHVSQGSESHGDTATDTM